MPKSKHINIVTLGCSKNVVDSEKLMRQIQSGGYKLTYDRDDSAAETVIINTCGFINDAKEESIDTILSFVKAKRSGKIRNLYVMGCLAERYMDVLKDEIPEVKRYFGVNSMTDILDELGMAFDSRLINERNITGPGHYAYLKVSEGCDRTCSFCAIPGIRGKCISRPIESIVDEARLLSEKGVKELILVAQDLSYYGLDLYKAQMLPALLKELVKIESLDWIRLHYLYPANFPLELISVIRDNPKICRYIDIPVQHITDSMLTAMKRTHNRKETEELLLSFRTELPDAAIRTTLITGFPGETEQDFKELKDFISGFRFDRLGVFAYSHEEDTYAFNHLEDNVPDKVKKERVSELMAIQQNISETLNSEKVGKVMTVIIDKTEGEFHTGRTQYDSPEVDQEVLIPVKYNLEPGKFYQIEITDSSEFDLFGMPV
jgi:ribosomal protein S12 methylthiotransferase